MSINMQPSLDLKQAIEKRRAARSFLPDAIPEVLLKQILELGVRAPSGYNLQPWRFVVVRDPEYKAQLRACAFDQRQVSEAPVVLICCGDRRVQQTDYIEAVIQLGKDNNAMTEQYADVVREKVPGLFANQPSFESVEAWTNRHTMLAVAHLMIVAKSFNIDTCPMEGFSAAKVREAFAIPSEVDICCLVAMGYAAPEPAKAYGGRFDLEQVCYGEKFGQPFQI